MSAQPNYAEAIAQVGWYGLKFDLNDDARICLYALALFARGEHHLFCVRPCNGGVIIDWPGTMTTFDFSELTQLVLIAHQWGVRISLRPTAKGFNVLATRRLSTDDETVPMTERHPTLSALIAQASSMLPKEGGDEA